MRLAVCCGVIHASHLNANSLEFGVEQEATPIQTTSEGEEERPVVKKRRDKMDFVEESGKIEYHPQQLRVPFLPRSRPPSQIWRAEQLHVPMPLPLNSLFNLEHNSPSIHQV